MEAIEEFLYEAFGILMFCLAVSMLLSMCSGLRKSEDLAASNLYDEHVFYTVANTEEGADEWIRLEK